MPKVLRGGKRGASAAMSAGTPIVIKTINVTPATPQQVAAGDVTPNGGVPFDKFKNMTDDEKAQVIIDSMGVTTPSFLDDSYLQKLSYYTGLSDKPQLVDEATLNSMSGQDLWRSVSSNYDRVNDINHTSREIAQQVMRGDYTMYSDSGGSVHGRAIYFDTTKGSYGSGNGYSIMHAKIASSAKMKSESTVRNGLSKEIASGSKLGNVLNKIQRSTDYASAMGVYCLSKGIDGYTDGYGYHMIINRKALVMSKTIF